MLNAVLFDLFETLITESATRPAGVSSLAPVLGCERDAFRREWKAIRPSVTTGDVTFRDAISGIATALGRHADEPTLERLRTDRIRIKSAPFAAVDPDLLDTVRVLRERGLRLGTISNCFAEDVTAWPRSALAPYFDATVFSFEARCAKPDRAIFLEATRRLGVNSAETLFVGDGLNDELAGAERAGLRPVLLRWFAKRWPHFRDEPSAYPIADTPSELLRIIERANAATTRARPPA